MGLDLELFQIYKKLQKIKFSFYLFRKNFKDKPINDRYLCMSTFLKFLKEFSLQKFFIPFFCFITFTFLISCFSQEIFEQLEPQKTKQTDFFTLPQNYEEIELEKGDLDALWKHSRYPATLSYRSYCYPVSISFEIVEEILVLTLKIAGLVNNSLDFEDFVDDSQTLDIDYENKNWVLLYEDKETQATGVADVTLLKSGYCFYSIHFVSEQRVYRSEKSVLDNFIRNFKP